MKCMILTGTAKHSLCNLRGIDWQVMGTRRRQAVYRAGLYVNSQEFE